MARRGGKSNSSQDAGRPGQSAWPRQTVPRLLPSAAHPFHSGSGSGCAVASGSVAAPAIPLPAGDKSHSEGVLLADTWCHQSL